MSLPHSVKDGIRYQLCGTKSTILLVEPSTDYDVCMHDIVYAGLITTPYSRRLWWQIKFGDLAVYLCTCQIKIHQFFVLAYDKCDNPLPNGSANILQWLVEAQPPNLNPVNFLSGCTV